MSSEFDLARARRTIHHETHAGNIQHVARLADQLALTLAEKLAERDAAVATIALLRAGETTFDLEATLAEIHKHAGAMPSPIKDVAVALAFRLFASRGAGVVTIDRLDTGLTSVETELRELVDAQADDIEALTRAYVTTHRAADALHTCYTPGGATTNCPGCVVAATIPAAITIAAAHNPSGATA